MANHPYNVLVVVPVAAAAAAEALASSVLGRPCDGEISAPLSADGQAPPTHRAAHVGLTASEYASLAAAFHGVGTSGDGLGAQVFTCILRGADDVPGASVTIGEETHAVHVIAGSEPVGDGHPLARRWTTERALADLGLRPVVPSSPF